MFNYKQILQQKYKPKTWAVITGGSQGIGREFAFQLGQLGFNICIISNDEEGMQYVIQKLSEMHKNIDLLTINADFSQALQNPQILVEIQDKLKKKDISILVNNVGINITGRFLGLSVQEIERIFIINNFSIFSMLKMLVGQMLKNQQNQQQIQEELINNNNNLNINHRSLIINMASITADIAIPFVACYSASKGFISGLSQSLKFNLKRNNYSQNFDIICPKPWAVTTALTKNSKGLFTINTKDCVEGILKQAAVVGEDIDTYGEWRHQICCNLLMYLNNYSERFFNFIMKYGYIIFIEKYKIFEY